MRVKVVADQNDLFGLGIPTVQKACQLLRPVRIGSLLTNSGITPALKRFGKPILLVITRDPTGKEKDDFFFTTDVTMDPAEVLACSPDRWAIEDTFKNAKQLLGVQSATGGQTYKAKGPERAAGLSLWLYSMVWLWYLKQKSSQRYFIVPPWYPQKLAPSFADALSCLRRELWRERIECMFGISAVHDKKFEL